MVQIKEYSLGGVSSGLSRDGSVFILHVRFILDEAVPEDEIRTVESEIEATFINDPFFKEQQQKFKYLQLKPREIEIKVFIDEEIRTQGWLQVLWWLKDSEEFYSKQTPKHLQTDLPFIKSSLREDNEILILLNEFNRELQKLSTSNEHERLILKEASLLFEAGKISDSIANAILKGLKIVQPIILLYGGWKAIMYFKLLSEALQVAFKTK